MRILFDIGHPAHVHLFRHLINDLEMSGHQTWIAAREKEVVTSLLDQFGLEYKVISSQQSGFVGLFIEYLEHSAKLYQMTRAFKPDLIVGCTPSVSIVSKVYPAKSIIFSEDDPESVRLAALLTYPPADYICMPDSIKSPWPKRISYPSYHKLAYLHPKRFTPDPSVYQDLRLEDGEPYFILRFVQLKSSHDFGKQGMGVDVRRRIVELLNKHGRIFISSEGRLSDEFVPYQIKIASNRIHHALYYASLFIGDSQSMTTEAAVLGTPSLRNNSFVGKCSVIEELQNKYGLTFGFLPGEENKLICKVEELLQTNNLKRIWQEKQAALLSEKIDLTDWMYSLIVNYPNSLLHYPSNPSLS